MTSDQTATSSGMVTDARWSRVAVVEQQQLAHDTYRLRLRCPEIARQIRPGQFFMIRPEGGTDPLLGRPFALYDTVDGADGTPESVDFVYHLIGKMTRRMSHWRVGEAAEMWGPLGNGFPAPDFRHLLYVGGGIGYTPVLAVAREALGDRQYGAPVRRVPQTAEQVTLLYGVRSLAHRANLADLQSVGDRLQVQIATDDGSEGHHGLVTDLLEQVLASAEVPDAVYCCGPVAMMHAAARICAEAGVDCWLSLESPMACGFGACFSCVTRVKTNDPAGWDYRRTCVEGPVFCGSDLVLG
jgi:dihydroorotate dehydrogenase electron transfer subunit